MYRLTRPRSRRDSFRFSRSAFEVGSITPGTKVIISARRFQPFWCGKHATFRSQVDFATSGIEDRFPTCKLRRDDPPLVSDNAPLEPFFPFFPHFAHFHPIFPHFARGWFPTWQVWTDSSPLRSGELSGSKFEVGTCPDGSLEVENDKGIFGICSLVPTWSGLGSHPHV